MKTLREFLADDLQKRVLLGGPPNTVRLLRGCISSFLNWLECEADAKAITLPGELQPVHVEKWLVWLRARRLRSGMALRPNTVASNVGSVRTFLNQLAKRQMVARSVTDVLCRIVRPRVLAKPTPAHRHIRRAFDDFKPASMRDHTMRAIVEVLYSTGMRPCELLGINLVDVDLDEGLVRVMGKGRRERMLPLGRRAVQLLESYLWGIRPVLLHDPAERALWLNSRGMRMSYDTMREGLIACFPVCGPFRLTAYSLRRACTTELIRSNASIWAVKELLGHQSLDELEHYVQLTINDLQKVHARCHPRDRMEMP